MEASLETTENLIKQSINKVKEKNKALAFIVALDKKVYYSINLQLFENNIIITTIDALEIDYNIDISNFTKDIFIIPLGKIDIK